MAFQEFLIRQINFIRVLSICEAYQSLFTRKKLSYIGTDVSYINDLDRVWFIWSNGTYLIFINRRRLCEIWNRYDILLSKVGKNDIYNLILKYQTFKAV